MSKSTLAREVAQQGKQHQQSNISQPASIGFKTGFFVHCKFKFLNWCLSHFLDLFVLFSVLS